ncbi:MAG: N-acetylmuramoyl-L-alanine amidase [Nitrospirota bacterium]|jgi:N-acetylmuramoyl-L-alanine amidase
MSKISALIALVILFSLPSTVCARRLERVVLDPGHGGFELGLKAGDRREKDISLSLAKRLRSALGAEGREVHLTREVDRYMSISARRSAVDSADPDVLLSLHLSDSENAVIYVAWYKEMEPELSLQEYYQLDSRQRRYIYESRKLANALGEVLGGELGVNVFYGELPLPLLSATGAPAVLVEVPSKGVVYNEDFIKRLANVLGAGIQVYEQR